MVGWAAYRETERKDHAVRSVASCVDDPAVRLHDVLGNRQPQACAMRSPGTVGLVEALEEAIEILWIDADTRILNLVNDPAFLFEN